MKTDDSYQSYFREFLFHETVEQARSDTQEIIPISQARAINARIHERMRAEGPTVYLRALDEEMAAAVPGYTAQYGDHTPRDPRCWAVWEDYKRRTGIAREGSWRNPVLPISPYDSRWAERASVKSAGTALVYLSGAAIEKATGGDLSRIASPDHGELMLWKDDASKKGSGAVQAGPAMTDEDACGLTALRSRMSERDYARVRDWAVAGGRDPRTGMVDRSRFMSPEAAARSAAVLDELQRQGVDYEVQRDLNPGQVKVRVSGTDLDIRLIDTVENERFAGARIYQNGMAAYYSTNRKAPDAGRTVSYTPSPAECVDLLRLAQGKPVQRPDGTTLGTAGTYPARGWNQASRSYDVVNRQMSYHAGRTSTFVVKDYEGPQARGGEKVMLHRDARNRGLGRFFTNTEAAETYLTEAVRTARENYMAALDVEGLIDHFYTAAQADPDVVAAVRADPTADPIDPPVFSGEPEIAAIQRSYWDVLTGQKDVLLRPGVTEAMYAERIGQIGASLDEEDFLDTSVGNMSILGSPEQMIRDHAEQLVEDLIGHAEPVPTFLDTGELADRRFDPVRVASYMTSETGQWQNLDSLAAALRRCEVSPSEMLGSGFNVARLKDRMIRFDESSAVPVADHPSATIARLGGEVVAAIERNGAAANSVEIDDHGVVRWEAVRMGPTGPQRYTEDLKDADGTVLEHRAGRPKTVTGEIGQIFDVGDYGEIVTDFASAENFLLVPGYEARISAQRPGESKSVEERTLLRGYEQLMSDQIAYQISSDLLTDRSEAGDGATLNRVYSRLYGTKHPVDFIEQLRAQAHNDQAKLDPWAEAILRTEARRVRYSNEIKENSTIHAEFTARRDGTDPADDNTFDAWRLTEGRNMAVLTGTDQYGRAIPTGFFDPVMTGGAKNQGIVRYLVEGAAVNPDGSIAPSADPADRTPLMKRPELDSTAYDPFDRRQMTASALMQSSEVTEPTGVALMTFGGWTADDPIVVSTRFAQEHRIRGVDGEMRDLVVGDKLSDLHGNKGVISLIVDPAMDPDEADRQHLGQEVAWFRANPDMDVVMSPFSMISRRNAGSARELMSGEVKDLVTPLGKDRMDAADAMAGQNPGESARPYQPGDLPAALVRPGALGQMRFIVTHMAVDAKTKIYDEDAVQQGQGRKASSQLAWALGAQGCDAIMREFYGHNAGAEGNFREVLGSVGIDMEADGALRVIGKAESLDERPERRLFAQPELIRNSAGSLATAAMRRNFGAVIGVQGGDMEVPWPLTYPTGQALETATENSWRMPVLSSYLRSGQEFEDGTSTTHDFTSRYLDIYELAFKYRDAVERLPYETARRDTLARDISQGRPVEREHAKAEKRVADLERVRDTAGSNAQLKFDSINNDLVERSLTGRRNIVKDGLMASRLADSATAVWTSDPRLDIDQVAIGPSMAAALHLEEGDHALVWRDPILHDGGLRYLRVTLDDRLTGVAINPVMDQCFDGDFDGDSVAVVKLHTVEAIRQAKEKLSVPANLLNTGMVTDHGNGLVTHPFAMQVSLDTSVALSKRPDLRETLGRLSGEANLNAVEPTYDDPEMNASIRQRNRDGNVDLTGRLSDFYRDAQRHEFGTALTFSTALDHVASVKAVCVDTGAKGSASKLADYATYLGLARDADGYHDLGRPGITEKDQQDSMYATAVKTFGTGLAGSFSQRAVRALRNDELKAVLELTYPVTQSILQAKHDAAEARHKYEVLMGPGRELWRGRLMESAGDTWKPVFEDGNPVQATREEWEAQFVEFYGSKAGFNVPGVNPDYVHRVAGALADKNGVMRNLEDDKAVSGSLMDRMAYGGGLKDLVKAAEKRENIFDGSLNEQFCSAPTRRQRAAQAGLESLDDVMSLDTSLAVPAVEAEVLKRDVLADHEASSRARAATRTSPLAVATTAKPPRPAPAFAAPAWAMQSADETTSIDYEPEF